MTKRDGSSHWYFRKRCPKHLLRPNGPKEVWISLQTANYQSALKKLDAARAEALAAFELPQPPSGIVSRTPRTMWLDDEALPTLSMDDVPLIARSYFWGALQDLDANPVRRSDFDRADQERIEQQMLDDAARLRDLSDPEEEDPALGVEMAILRQRKLRSAYKSPASVLLRE